MAFGETSEIHRMEWLKQLEGVGLRTASALLHIGHLGRYPLMDLRTLWSIGIDSYPDDELSLWRQYIPFCRQLAEECQFDMRTLDRALWQYSKEKQP